MAAVALFVACRKGPPDEIVLGTPAAGATPSTPSTAVPVPANLKSQVLVALADCAVDRFREFESRARELRDAARLAATNRTPANADAARAAWLSAMGTWEQAEMFNFGPSLPTSASGGKGYRDAIYAWPLGSRCKVDEQIVSKAYAAPAFANSLISGRTLTALEYLLFYSGADNGCAASSPINGGGTWAAVADLPVRKADYAAAVADDVLVRATLLLDAWEPTKGNFRNELATAGAGSKVYTADQTALNAISDAMFYLDKEVKDAKVGKPLGISECFTPSCADQVESMYAKASTAHLRANVEGFRRLFEGCGADGAGLGFDDLLRAAGAGDLADRMTRALADLRTTLATFDPPLEQAVVSAPDKANALYQRIKALTDLLKTEFVTVLNLELPSASEGDND